MKDFNPINRPIQPSQTLEVLANSYNTIEQKHFETVKATSELESAMANLELNEAEDAFRQEKIAEIRQTLEDNLIAGNAYAALPAIVQKVGDINSDQRMIGRLRAQKDYLEFQKKVDEMAMPDHYKSFFKKINNYEYADKVDRNGNVIGGTKWTPKREPVESVDMNEVLKAAATYASPDSKGYTSTAFITADGQISKEWIPGSTIGVFNTQTNKYEKLPEEKLKEALAAAIRSNPKIRASLYQDWEVANWQFDEDGIAGNIFNSDGSRKTFNEYVESIADPWAKAKAYNNRVYTDNYNNPLLNSTMSKGAEQVNPIDVFDNIDLTLNHGNNQQVESDTYYKANEAVNIANAKLRSDISKILPDVDPNTFNINDISAMQETLRQKGISEEAIEELTLKAEALRNTNKEELHNNDRILKSANPKGIAAFRMYSSLESGLPVNPALYENDENAKRIIREYNSITNSYFDIENGGVALEQPCTDKNRLRKFIEYIGGESAMRGMGIQLNYDEDGDAVIYVPAEIGTNFSKYTEAYSRAYDETNIFLQAGNMVKRVIDKGDTPRRVYSDGRRENLGLMTKSKANHNARTNAGAAVADTWTGLRYIAGLSTAGATEDVSPSEFYAPVTTFKKRMKEWSESAIGTTKKTVETVYALGGSVKEAIMREMAKNTIDAKELAQIKKNLELDEEATQKNLSNLNFANAGIMIFNDKEQKYMPPKDSDIQAIRDYIQNTDKIAKATGRLELLPTSGQFTYGYTIPVKDADAPIRIIITNPNDPQLQRMNANPILGGVGAVNKSFMDDYDLYLGTAEGGDIYATPVTTQKGERLFNVSFEDGSNYGTLSIEQVQNIKGVQKRIEYFAKRTSVGSPEFVDSYNRFVAVNKHILSSNEEKLKEVFVKMWTDYANK